MPKLATTREELEQLVNELRKDTSGFKSITPQVVARKSKYLLLLRLNEGLSQPAFENLLGMSKNIAKYETGTISQLRLGTAEKVLAKTRTDFSPTRVFESFERFRKNSEGWFKAQGATSAASRARQKGALTVMQKRSTTQEQQVLGALREMGLKAKLNKPLSRKVVTDVFVESKPPVILECKRLETFNRRQQTKKIRELAYQGYKIKFLRPGARIIAVLEAKLPLQESDFDELRGPFDMVCTDLQKLRSCF